MEWKIIEGTTYEVSNTGLIRNEKGVIMKQRIQNKGYNIIDLRIDGIKYTRTVHKLVANAFLPPDATKIFIDHIDRNKLNNNVNNLRRCNSSENNYNRNCKKGSKRNIKNRNNKYQVCIQGNNKCFKTFDNIDDAKKWRDTKLLLP